ncbi:MAG TPA: hypothetical protein VGN88_01280 [Phycisphaerae bacterium]
MTPAPSTNLRSKPSTVAASRWRSQTRRDQAYAVALGIVLVGCSVLMQNVLEGKRPALVREDPESEKTLTNLAVTFPRLTLGGMRGVASTYLWMKAEDDKNDRHWLDLETKYDMIGALQPYFASVYIYHSWNQAYNLSAQWQEQEIKYKWVLDGIAYLYKGEDFNPGNPDILVEEAQLYAQKLGSASERIFYRAHWRHDISRLHELNTMKEAKTDDAVALQHVRAFVTHNDPRDPPDLAPKDRYFHTEEMTDPERPGSTALGWGIRIYPDIDLKTGFNLFSSRKDGLKPTDPIEYRYGVSPFYFAYLEYKRLLKLSVGPTYSGLMVTDGWPAMSLRLWCRDDLYYIGDSMRQMFGPEPNKALLEPVEFATRSAEMQECQRNIAMISPRAVDLFHEHLGRYPNNMNVHGKHILEVQSYTFIADAELKLYNALVAWHLAGEKKDDKIKKALMDADDAYLKAVPEVNKWVENMYPTVAGETPNPDRDDFARYAAALLGRSKGIEAFLNLPEGQKPDMTFLKDDVVER